MAQIIVVTRKGDERAIAARDGLSVMEIARNGGVHEIMAICGGACSCATCHVYVDPAFAARLPAMTEFESDLLDGSDHRKDTSRLSCQLPFDASLDGLRVTVAPED